MEKKRARGELITTFKIYKQTDETDSEQFYKQVGTEQEEDIT